MTTTPPADIKEWAVKLLTLWRDAGNPQLQLNYVEGGSAREQLLALFDEWRAMVLAKSDDAEKVRWLGKISQTEEAVLKSLPSFRGAVH